MDIIYLLSKIHDFSMAALSVLFKSTWEVTLFRVASNTQIILNRRNVSSRATFFQKFLKLTLGKTDQSPVVSWHLITADNYNYDDVIGDCKNELDWVSPSRVICCPTDDHDNDDNKGERFCRIENWGRTGWELFPSRTSSVSYRHLKLLLHCKQALNLPRAWAHTFEWICAVVTITIIGCHCSGCGLTGYEG